MQRKPTKNTRVPNAAERSFQAWTKDCDCIVCGNPGPSIVDHCFGATFKHMKVLIGHWFVIPLCVECDNVKTHGSNKVFREMFDSCSYLWDKHHMRCPCIVPDEVIQAIDDWGK